MLTIVHTPFGHEHPYEQLPEERFPRQPLAGEPFTIGIVTRPSGAARQVRVYSRLDDGPVNLLDAVQDTTWQQKHEQGVGAEFLERLVRVEQDVWHAVLTAPAFGHTLHYWLESEGVQSEVYSVRGEAWQPAVDWSEAIQFKGMDSAQWPAVQRVEWLTDGQHKRRVRLSFPAQPDERFFGLGERFNALNQREQVLDVRVYEQYKNQDQRTYLPIPFLLSSAGYGVYVESSRWMQFDLAASAPDQWTLEADLGPDETLSLRCFSGSDPLAIIAQFTNLTGPAALPPEWAFGLWMSSNEWNSQERVEREVQTSLDHGIQPSVVVIEAWSDETTFYIWNDAEYDPRPGSASFRYSDFHFPPEGKWPNPKGMVDWLHANGMKLLLWQIPVLKVLEQPHPQHGADRAHFEQSGFGVRETDGSLHKVRPFWFRGGYIWDVTNPAERDWWLNKRAYLLDDLGIDGFKTDGGEHLWGSQTRFADGRRGAELWNEYPQRYTSAYYDMAQKKRAGVTFSRAGFVGSQRSPLHWAGDENSTWEAFRHSILAGLNAGISGIPFWGWDFAGFSGEIPSAELYLRAAAMAVFCPVMQYHSEYNPQRIPSRDRTPWNIQERTGDARVIPIFKQLAAVRERLRPYIWQEAQHTAATGEPLMRALRLWYPQASDYQYFFGRDLLVCPVVEPGRESWECYLPPGEWRDFWTGVVLMGDQVVTVDAPLVRIPVFSRSDRH
ncbi:MAG: glycoside hydrolase family 31 [Anaerolineae bacterium]|nr:glycoside hydrolase family 31 [Anaerolineae bacterium]